MINYIEYANDFIKNELKPHMKSNGLKVKGQFFYIETEDFIKFICIDKSSWNHKTTCSLSFRISIFDKIAAKHLKELIHLTKTPHNTLLNIIQPKLRGTESTRHSDHYDFNSETNLDELKQKILHHLDNILIPFINSFETKNDLLKIYKSPPRMWLGPAVLLELCIGIHEIENGNKKQGIQHIQNWIEVEKNRGYNTELVNSVAKKLENNEFEVG